MNVPQAEHAVSNGGTAIYSGISVNNGQSISGHNNIDQRVNIQNYYSSSPGVYPGIDILLGASEPDAAVDAEARAYSPRCFPGTREQYIDEITKWMSASEGVQLPSIYWMYGPACVGKSAIAQTCAELVNESGHLGAAFFFSVNGRNDHTRFFPTIAYQLSTVLSEYKKKLNDVVLNDKTIVKKTIASQFKMLIVEPLRGLKEVPKKAIFIDGLDECQSTHAQSQIIELIATSVRDATTPFRWAFFSRPEIHIETTFALDYVRPLCNTILLPISRDIDGEVQLYLEGGFKNILHQQSVISSTPWPPPEAIQKLVDASAGLYAYPAAVLRFIDSFPSGDPEEALALVLHVLLQPNSGVGPSTPFAQLDAFYLLIMEQIPNHLLLSMQFLFYYITCFGTDPHNRFAIASYFNNLHLSEAYLQAMRKHLHAVLYFRDAPAALPLGVDIDITRPYYEQRIPSDWESDVIFSSLGRLGFHHKSFYDFLVDPSRSAGFCVITPELGLKFFEHTLQIHLDLAQYYIVQGIELVLIPDLPASSSVLSFPLENRFYNSFIQDMAFWGSLIWAEISCFSGFLLKFPHHTLQKLSEMDYRKHLLVSLRLSSGLDKSGDPMQYRRCFKSDFRRITQDTTQRFDCATFLSTIKLLKKLRIIEPYHPTFSSRVKRFLQVKRTESQRSGLYIVGRGEKSVFWYWELNTDLKEYRGFLTLDFPRAMGIFRSHKHQIWDEDWTLPLL